MTPRKALCAALVAVLLSIGGALAQAPAPGPARLLRDINEVPTYEAGSFASDFVQLGGIVLFVADSREAGRSLWRTDGTKAGTSLVKDIDPGSYYHGPSGLTAYGGAVYFGADDGIHGPELWRSDGTEAGTVLVKDIAPGPRGSLLQTRIVVFDGRMFFKANDTVHGLELWTSDGTESGTVLLKDTEPGTTSWGGLDGNEIVLIEAGGSLFFMSVDFVHGSELWRTDGTEAGTVLVKDINTQSLEDGYPLSSHVLSLFPHDGVLYFAADDGIHGYELWKSDGTENGTVMVKDINPERAEHPVETATRRTGAVERADGRADRRLPQEPFSIRDRGGRPALKARRGAASCRT